jgi:hypothetical protein
MTHIERERKKGKHMYTKKKIWAKKNSIARRMTSYIWSPGIEKRQNG